MPRFKNALRLPPAGSAFQFSFTNSAVLDFFALAATNSALPLSAWTVLGHVSQMSPGAHQFIDFAATTSQRFYKVVSP